MIDWPPLTPGGPRPVWNGDGFTVAGQPVSVLCYNEHDSAWSDGLTRLHEESAGREHYIHRASRLHALQALAPVLAQSAPVVLEVGCSSGYFLEDLRKAAPHCHTIGSDFLASVLDRLVGQLPGVPLVQFDLTTAPLADNTFDAIVALNVLEHIKDDRQALAEVVRMLKPGGLAVIEVPAGPGLYDFYDAHLMHHRRYTRERLRQMAEELGLEERKASHLGFFLYPAFALLKKRNRRLGRTLSDEEREQLVSRQIQLARSSRVLNALMWCELALGRLVNYPWGIRCLLTARKPLSTAHPATYPALETQRNSHPTAGTSLRDPPHNTNAAHRKPSALALGLVGGQLPVDR